MEENGTERFFGPNDSGEIALRNIDTGNHWYCIFS